MLEYAFIYYEYNNKDDEPEYAWLQIYEKEKIDEDDFGTSYIIKKGKIIKNFNKKDYRIYSRKEQVYEKLTFREFNIKGVFIKNGIFEFENEEDFVLYKKLKTPVEIIEEIKNKKGN